MLDRINDYQNKVDNEQDNQCNFQTDTRRVRPVYHSLCDIGRKCLHQHILAVRNIGDAEIIRPAVLRADKRALAAFLENVSHRLCRTAVNKALFLQNIRQAFLSVFQIIRACYHSSVRHTQPGNGRLSEIGRMQNLFQALLRHIRSADNSDDFPVYRHRRIKHDSLFFFRKPLVKYSNNPVLALHAQLKVSTVGRIHRSAVGQMRNPFRIGKTNRIKNRNFFYPLKHI